MIIATKCFLIAVGQIVFGLVLYKSRIEKILNLTRSDLVVFGLPILMGAIGYWFIISTEKISLDFKLFNSFPFRMFVVMFLAFVVQLITFIIAANIYGT